MSARVDPAVLRKEAILDRVMAARKQAEGVASVAKLILWIGSIIGVGLAIHATPWWSWLLIVPLCLGTTLAASTFIDRFAKAHWVNVGLRLEVME